MTQIITLFNNKGGVGKTTLAYHLAHMFARLGWRTLAVDLDPQANLTSAFFDDDQVEKLWAPEGGQTVYTAVQPIVRGLGDVRPPEVQEVADRLYVVAGDIGLSRFESRLSDSWPRGYEGDESALRATTAFYRLIRAESSIVAADIVVVDVGPNLGAINRSALLASDHVLVPLAADLFSLQGLRNLGPTLREWRANWQSKARPMAPAHLEVPDGSMNPLGYVVLQHAMRLDRPVQAYEPWLRRIPGELHQAVLGEAETDRSGVDPYQLASLRNYRSLMPLAHDARKPMFDLRAADGALGSTGRLVQRCTRTSRSWPGRLRRTPA